MLIESIACIALTKALIYDKITYYSQELGAYESMVDYIVRNESQYNNCAAGDFHVPRPSFGLAQINLYYNPTVTQSEAYNPDFAIPYLINDLRAGKWRKWTTARAFQKLHPDHPYFQNNT